MEGVTQIVIQIIPEGPLREECGIGVTQKQKLFEGTCLFEKRALLLQSELFVFLGMKECRTWGGRLARKAFWNCNEMAVFVLGRVSGLRSHLL